MVDILEKGGRIEVSGLGSFGLKLRHPRIARNPKTGDPVKGDERPGRGLVANLFYGLMG
jgi:integration host factor subunit beta